MIACVRAGMHACIIPYIIMGPAQMEWLAIEQGGGGGMFCRNGSYAICKPDLVRTRKQRSMFLFLLIYLLIYLLPLPPSPPPSAPLLWPIRVDTLRTSTTTPSDVSTNPGNEFMVGCFCSTTRQTGSGTIWCLLSEQRTN
eukprot:GHVU01182071.1.p2 GENE.GHVU01182071.1~~GHVU01182071.1.p2  ORF type:complete len:140 (-),score=8.73 GHVU01182071.1:58-477(-)